MASHTLALTHVSRACIAKRSAEDGSVQTDSNLGRQIHLLSTVGAQGSTAERSHGHELSTIAKCLLCESLVRRTDGQHYAIDTMLVGRTGHY